MAIFLIASTQLTVSYFIDFGNAITEPVKRAIDSTTLQESSQQITAPTKNLTAAQAVALNNSESTATATTRALFASLEALLNTALMVLSLYQLVMICYLFLLGPVAAAMFAWPSGIGSLFSNVFANWLNAFGQPRAVAILVVHYSSLYDDSNPVVARDGCI